METLGIYIQVPFCASKCSFCNFSSRVTRNDVYDRYYLALAEEIRFLPKIYRHAGIAPDLLPFSVDTVYIGGGTPPLLGIDHIARLLSHLHRRFRFAPKVEFTMEVTPGSASEDLFERGLALGINRLSFGAQSFNDSELRSVGRLHSAEDTRTAVQTARQVGVTNISLDLIAGLPHQTELSWKASLEAVISLRPEHISVYLFEIDEKSRLGSEALRNGTRYHADALPDDDFMAEAYDQARVLLREAGYIQYEISNFSLPGYESIHNRKYWQLKPYVGLGAGAHSSDGQFRWENVTSVEEYQSRLKHCESPIFDRHRLTRDAQLEEFFFLGLRQLEGVKLAEARRRWGHELVERWVRKIESLERDGWLKQKNGNVRLVDKALLVSNEVFQEFIGI